MRAVLTTRPATAAVAALLVLLGAAGVVAAPATPAAASAPRGAAEVTVVLVAPPGTEPDGTTVQQVVDAVEGPVADFWWEQARFPVSVAAAHDWMTTSAGCDDPEALWEEVHQRVAPLGAYGHLLLYMSSTPALPAGCPRGLSALETSDTGPWHPFAFVRDLAPSLIAHQIGHGFGVEHASRLQCDRSLHLGNCRVVDGGDRYDVMGTPWAQLGSITVAHENRLGLLGFDERVDFYGGGAGGTVTLAPVSTRGGVRVIRLRSVPGDFWLEYRPAAGRDAWLGTAADPFGLDSGVQVRQGSHIRGHGSLLLDATPSPRSGWAGDTSTSLPVGVPVSLRSGEYVVTVESVTAGAATVRVREGDPALPRDLSGDGDADLLAVDGAGNLLLYPGDGAGGFEPRQVLGRGWQARDLVTLAGDWDGDGRHDVLARNPSTGELWLYRGNGAGGFLGWGVVGRGWGTVNALFSPGDVNEDGAVDLLARRASDGVLLLYRGNGRGGFLPTQPLGGGWHGVTEFAPLDHGSSGTLAVFTARLRDGSLHRYVAHPSGGILSRTRIGAGWQSFTRVVGVGDWSGDFRADLLARRSDGALLLYTGTEQGGLAPAGQVGRGWGGLRLAS